MGASISIRFLTKRRNQTSQANHLISSRSSRKKSSNFLFSFFLNSVAPLVPSCSASGFTGPSGFASSSPSCFWIFPLKERRKKERRKDEVCRAAAAEERNQQTKDRKTERRRERERRREKKREEDYSDDTNSLPVSLPLPFLSVSQ